MPLANCTPGLAPARPTLRRDRTQRLSRNVAIEQTSAHHDPLSAATLRAAERVGRDTWLFLGTALAAHAAVVVNLMAVLL